MSQRAALGLAVAVAAVSWGGPLARLVDAAPLAVAAWRMVLATALAVPVAIVAGRPWPTAGARRASLLAGLFLGLHFGLWIPSLWLTTVSASVVLVTTAPLWVLLASPRVLGVPIRPRSLVSFLVALAGVVVIAGGDFIVSPRALVGDLLAVGGALAAAGYLLVGKRLRAQVALLPYLAVVYLVAAVTLVAATVALRVELLPRSPSAWLVLAALAAGPTLIGHSLLNWALKFFEAFKVNLVVLLEPVLASLLAWLVLREAPPLHVLPGAALVLAALALEYGVLEGWRHRRGGAGRGRGSPC